MQSVAEDRVGQFIEIADEALYAGVDEFLRDAVPAAARVDQPGNVVERPAVARTDERRTHGFAATAHRQQLLRGD